MSMIKEALSNYYSAFVKIPLSIMHNIPPSEVSNSDKINSLLNKYAEQAHFTTLHEKTRIKEVTLAEVFGRDIEKVMVPFGSIDEESGKPNAAELLYVNTVARHLKAKNIFEFGTFIGRTTYHLTGASEGAVVTTLDLPPGKGLSPYQGSYFAGTSEANKIKQIFIDSKQFDTAPYKKSMDFIFVDGDHSYEGVKNDTIKAFEMLAPGGCIMWHDYGPRNDPGLVNFFVEFTQNRPLFWIKKTSLLMYIDGIDPMKFQVHPMRTRFA